jgi:hypothetical protein
LKQAIDTLLKRGELMKVDADTLKDLLTKNDKHLNAIWETYQVVKRDDDFLDSLNVLCDVRREQRAIESQSNQYSAPTANWQANSSN